MRIPATLLCCALTLAAISCGPATQAAAVEYGYEIVHAYPHDTLAFTEGLFLLDGVMYESTGLEGESHIRKVKLETGEVLQNHALPRQYFGEGIIHWKDRIIGLTYKTEIGFIYDGATLEVKGDFRYPGEGWALTQDGQRIYMSDGTSEIRIWDPETLKETGRIQVTDQGQPVNNVNELEWVRGEIFANVWTTDRIARIDPSTGNVTGWIDLTGLLKREDRIEGRTDVLNGIAYDAANDRLFVTGKRWPKLFEIRLVKR
jgi:glutaminyl-peptide cyclotransferase